MVGFVRATSSGRQGSRALLRTLLRREQVPIGQVGRFRVNRKFNEDVDESIMHIRPEDFLEIIKYMLKLRAQDESAYIDDIDHLSNRRLRTLDELAVDESEGLRQVASYGPRAA